jgi:ubiquinone/menaquinone biosynthesis C-methylase UbiE
LDSAARSFGVYSQSYEKSRPGYSKTSIDLITKKFSLNAHSKILELGAGTGKFTSALVNQGLTPVVTDWCSKMLRVLYDKYPYLEIAVADAYNVPLQSNIFDVVIVAQAFHWFATKDVLSEISRVLKPGGYLVLVFQERVENNEWVKEFHKILYSYPYDARARFELGAWKQVFEDQSYFEALQHESFPYIQNIAKEDLVHRALGTSFMTTLSEDKRNSAVLRIKELCSSHVELCEQTIIEFFYNTHVYWARSIK